MLLNLQRFYDEDTTNGTGAKEVKPGEATVTEETKTPEQAKPYKVFTTEDEYQKELKSAQSKAKNEILKSLGVNSVDDGKTNLTKAEQLEKDLQAAVTKLNGLEEENALVKAQVSEDFREEALVLARAKTDLPLDKALAEVVKKFPNLQGKAAQKGLEKAGSEKTETPGNEDSLNKDLMAKYPWLKL